MTMIRNTERPFSNRNGGNEKGVERGKWSSFSPDLNLIDEKRKGKKWIWIKTEALLKRILAMMSRKSWLILFQIVCMKSFEWTAVQLNSHSWKIIHFHNWKSFFLCSCRDNFRRWKTILCVFFNKLWTTWSIELKLSRFLHDTSIYMLVKWATSLAFVTSEIRDGEQNFYLLVG